MHGSQIDWRDRLPASPSSVNMLRLTSGHMLGHRSVAEESPIALVYDGTTVAVLMATPADLADFAIGFSLTEGIIEDLGEINELTVVPGPDGIELRLWLRPRAGRQLKERRRRLIGPTGCGLCGIESLREVSATVRRLERHIDLTPQHIRRSVETLAASQILGKATRATHAAGFFQPDADDMIVREDVGRHNALDKLAGALAAAGIPGHSGAVILTSRISVEMVQKTAAIGAGFIVAVSAPTALAIRTAAASGITLIGIARGQDFEVFSHFGGIHDQ